MITIASDRLLVTLAPTDHPHPLPRFSRVGYVTQVELDGRHAFCGSEGVHSGFSTYGAGLCQEFGLEGPCGYHDCLPGEEFPKPGVGLLRRLDLHRYRLFDPYPCTPFPMRTQVAPDRVHFTVDPLPCRGYALGLEQTVTVAGNRLEIACTARNCGERGLLLEEYRHDFLAPGGRNAAPEMTLRFDRPLRPRAYQRTWGLAEDGRSMALVPEQGPARPRWGIDLDDGPLAWTLHDPATGLGLTHATDRPWSRFNCWIGSQSFSPEAFLTLACRPGEAVSWRRTWTFTVTGR